MPLSIEFDTRTDGVIVTASGEISTPEILEAKQQIYFQSNLERLVYQIWHFPDGPGRERAHDELRSMAIVDAEAVKLFPGMLVALVLGGKPIREETRLYLLYSSVWAKQMRTQLFGTVEQAREWIERERRLTTAS